jgi:alkylation response protein AidB-like acyl-CoA dehydrogenase
MGFDRAGEQKMIQAVSRTFAREVIAPRVLEMEAMGEYLSDIIDQMAEVGMMGIPFPEDCGGYRLTDVHTGSRSYREPRFIRL